MKELPSWVKIVYGIPQAGLFLIDPIVVSWIFYYYTIGALNGETLVSPAVIGIIFFIGRMTDAIGDPVIARLSDNLDSPWGRRIPFMAVSGILKVAIFIALFHPPVQHEPFWNAVYLAALLFFYFIVFTAYGCPYLALIPELARSTGERVELSTYKAVFGMLGTGAALIGAGIIIDMYGFRYMAWIFGLTALILLYVPLLIREKDYADTKPSTMGFTAAIRNTLQNRPFVIYLAGCLSFWFGVNIVLQCVPFYVTVLLGRSEGDTAFFFAAAGVLAVVSFLCIRQLSQKWGLKKMIMLAMIILVIILPQTYFLGIPVAGVDPFIVALLLMSVAGIPFAILLVIPDTLVATISDYDEGKTGQRREAMYYGVQGLIMKMAIGMSSIVMGGLFQFFGQTADQPLGIQLTGPVAAFFVLAGLLIFSRYPEQKVSLTGSPPVPVTEE